MSEKIFGSAMHSSNIDRKQACDISAKELALLFTKMALTRQKYTEPSDVLRSLVDDFG